MGCSNVSNQSEHLCTARDTWLPVAYIVLMMIVALVGNTLVIFIYNCRWRSAGTTKVYVSVLASLDVFAAVILMPRDLMTLTFTSTDDLGIYFDPDAFCAIVTYAGFVLHVASSFVLATIAVSRYSKATQYLTAMTGSSPQQVNAQRPIRNKLLHFLNTHRGAKMASIAIFGTTLVLALPSALLYGNTTEKFCIFQHCYNRTCYLACGLKKTSNKTLTDAFVAFVLVVFAGVFFTLTSMYIAVGRHLRASEKNQRRWLAQKPESFKKTHTDAGKSQPEDGSDEQDPETVVHSSCRKREHVYNETSAEQVCAPFLFPPVSYSSLEMSAQTKSADYLGESDGDESSRRKSVLADSLQKSKKKTIAMMIITIIFILSYLPFLSLSVLRPVMPDFCSRFSRDWQMISEVLWRSFYISNAANPIVYGFCSLTFRRVLWKTLRWQTEVI